MKTNTWMRSPSATALVMAGLLAVVQAALFAVLISTQRNAAHVVDISGMQRMQSQRIAFLAFEAHAGLPPSIWRVELEHACNAVLAVRAELRRDPSLASGVIGADGKTALRRLADRYLDAARTLVRDPSNEAAYATISELRKPLLTGSDEAVKLRVKVLTTRDDRLVYGIAAGLMFQLLVLGLSWLRVAAPAERRVRRLLDAVTEEEERMRSLFDENPDAIAVYDVNGHLLRVNRARATLGGHATHEMIGKHYSTFVTPVRTPGRLGNFERALRGETVATENLFRSLTGETIETKMTFFPNVIRGVVSGVIVVSRDIRALKAAERAYTEETRRVADLYAIAAAEGKNMRERLADALSLAARHLDYGWGAVTEISSGKSNLVATFGDPAGAAPRAFEQLHRAIGSHVVNANDVWAVDDFAESAWLRAATFGSWQSMAGMRIEVAGMLYGVVAFASDSVRERSLSEGDRHFLRLVSALMGSIIERDQRERKLDSLAFFDALTGLPNRVLLLDRLEELVTASQHRNVHFALLFIDLDRFKPINDDFGHGTGDAVLRAVAQRLETCVRETDTVARLGGDEFVVLLSRSEGAEDFARRVVRKLSEPIPVKEQYYTVGASVGIALFPSDAESGMELLAAADRALYHAKRNGRGRYAFVRDVPGDGGGEFETVEGDDAAGTVTPIRGKDRRRRSLRG